MIHSLKIITVALTLTLYSFGAFAASNVVVIPLFGDDAASKWRGDWGAGIDYKTSDIVGNDGSSYIAKSDHTSTGVGSPLDSSLWDLIAASGEDGMDGAQGQQGESGADSTVPGPEGPAGPQGPPGEDSVVPGPDGADGPQWRGAWLSGTVYESGDIVSEAGSSYIAISGHTAQAGDTPLDLNTLLWDTLAVAGSPGGDPGPQGPPGEDGAPGSDGNDGADGAPGNDGAVGAVGPAGSQGPPGNDGAAGAVGPIGPQGPPGEDGAPGSDGNDGAVGAVGPAGSQGPPGNDGAVGAPGNDGAVGAVGPIGPQGPAGNDGAAGAPGNDGAVGAVGPIGPQGPTGNDGAAGAPGNDGAVGAVGPAGSQGLPGNDGAVGAVGAVGPAGSQGPPGNDGAVGAVGPAGSQGLAGNDGAAGAVGPAGPAGTDGIDAQAPAKIIWVAESGADFSDPIAAVNSIVNPTGSNPYLVRIAPGTYDLSGQQLVMKQFVSIQGSGQNITTLFGAVGSASVGSSAALLVGTNNASLRDITIYNTDPASAVNIGVYNNTTSLEISNVTISVIGGGEQYGVYSTVSDTTISDAKINVVGGSGNQFGFYSSATATSTPFSIIRNSKITAPSNSVNVSAGSGVYISDSILSSGVSGYTKCSFVFLTDGTALDPNCSTP